VKKVLLFLFVFGIAQLFASTTDEEKEMKFTSAFIEANKEKMLGNEQEAFDLFLKCLELDDRSSASMFEIARILSNRKDISSAIAMMEKAVEYNAENQIYKVFLVSLYLEVNNYKDAVVILEELLKSDPYNLEHHLNLASVYISMNKYKKAKQIYENAEKLFGDDETLLEEVLKCELIFGKYENVYKNLNGLIEEYPDDERYYNILAETYIHNKRYADALAVYDTLLKITSDTTDVHLSKLDIYIETNDQQKFLDELHFIFADPNIKTDLKVETLLKLAQDKSGILSKEMYNSYVIQLFSIHPDNIPIRIAYTEYLLKNDSIQQAVPHLYYILTKEKSNYLIYEQLLFIENGNEKWDSVYSISSEALEYYPLNPLFYFYNGFSLSQLGKYNDAIDIFLSGLHYIQDNSLKSEFYVQIAECYYKKGSKKLAYQFFEKTLSVNPQNALVLNNYSYYLSLDKSDLPKALEMSILSNKLSPDNPIFLDTHAWVLYQMENYTGALEIQLRAYELGGKENAEVVEHLGDIYQRLGNIEEALKFWEEAYSLDDTKKELKEKIATATK